MKFPVHFTRVAAVFATVAAIGSTLMFGAPVAQASSNEPTSTTAAAAGSDPTVPIERLFVIESDGTTVEVPPETDVTALGLTFYTWFFGGASQCYEFRMCLWTADHYDGVGLRMGGDLAACEGFRFEGTFMQLQGVHSIWNRTSGSASIWDRYHDGSFNYQKIALLPTGYSHDTQFSRAMDAWVFDPHNNCTRLNLHLVVNPE